MSQPEDDKAVQPSVLIRADEIQEQIQKLSGRDLQLWSIGILVILVLTSGLLALIVPNLVWAQRMVHVEHSYLPQLFFGLISLGSAVQYLSAVTKEDAQQHAPGIDS